ncbi:MAG: beta-propeller domain-containing protein, partial [Lachnospiraceae bacterium]|nr:beta-propeller domain-containing protein [Lachnospiraceae bacterium]
MKNRFDEDGVRAPESLSAENMMKMLQEQENAATAPQSAPEAARTAEQTAAPKPAVAAFKKYRGYITALAACLILSLIAIPAVRSATRPEKAATGAANEAADGETGTAAVKAAKTLSDASFRKAVADGEIETFKDKGEIEKIIKDLNPKNGIITYGQYAKTEELAEGETLAVNGDMDAAKSDAVPGAAAESAAESAASGSTSHSDTYRQVGGVDEADIIKTDGKFIYIVSGYNEVEIYRADKGKTEKVARITQFDDDGEIHNMYLDGDRLITVGLIYKDQETRSVVTCYDISDHADPKEEGRFEQSGYVVSSRMTGGVVYLVTEDMADRHHCFPCVLTKGRYRELPVNDICAFPQPQMSTYVVVSAVDFKTGKKISSQSKAVLGAGREIYCNTDNLYIACQDYSGSTVKTRLMKIALNGGKLKFTAAGKVRGSVYGQFAMDEKDGYFRIATTADKNGKDVNNLYVLDGELNEVGSVTGFARNEHIEAVRFIGTRAYVITYEQIDPLFILDLSDPADPRIDGEVEITGFSTLLVPIS